MLVVFPAFGCYAYNLAVMGGLLTLDSFIRTFPSLDTITTTGAQQEYNAKIQGECHLPNARQLLFNIL